MSVSSDMRFEMHIDDVEIYTENSIKKALEVIGLKAETYAKAKCPVDTGLLRNSIAHAVSGNAPKIGGVSAVGESAERVYKASNPDKDGKIHIGIYSKNKKLPNLKNDIRVYIGTNVEYAPYVEMGHIDARSGKHIKAQPFIKPALMNHLPEWQEIFMSIVPEAMKEELEHKRGTFTREKKTKNNKSSN